MLSYLKSPVALSIFVAFSIFSNIASVKSAPLTFAPDKSDPSKFVFRNIAPLILAFINSEPLNFGC